MGADHRRPRRSRLRLAERDPAAAIRAVAAVIPEARERGLPFELGRCLLMLGTAQRKARRRRDVAATLDEAAAVFDSLGAQGWQALATAQRARLAPGSDSTLTPTERRIADLVAAGHTNPENRHHPAHQRQGCRGQPDPHLPQTRLPQPH